MARNVYGGYCRECGRWTPPGFGHFERVLECVGYTEGNVFDYLADLVDRGECENVYDGSVQDSCDNGFLCSVCGCKVEDEEHYRVSGVWNYCPQCGRKVRHG